MICKECGNKILPGEPTRLSAPAGTPGVDQQHVACWRERRKNNRLANSMMTAEELTESLLRDFGLKS